MSLLNLNTPYERRRIIHYGIDGNKVVRHWFEVQQVVGALYKSRETKNEYNEVVFDLFILFDGVKDGILYAREMKHPEWYTVEKLEAEMIQYGYDTAEHFLASLDSMMERQQWIGNAMIEFVRQFNTGKADEYATYRENLLRLREERERQREAERQAKEEAERKAAEEALQAEKAKYMGWADNMTNMRFGRVSSIMEKLTRVNGKVMTRREFIVGLVNDGWTPDERKDVTSYYGSRWDKKQSKPKTEYLMCRNNRCYTVNKTEYEFAVFLSAQNKQEVKESA